MSSDLRPSTRVVAVADHASARVEDEQILLDFGSRSYFGLNDVANRIWELVQEPSTVEELRDRIVEEYEVSPERCEADLQAFLKEMADHGLVEFLP